MTVKDLEVGQTLNLSGWHGIGRRRDDELELEVVRLRPKEMLVDLFSFDIGGLDTVAFKISQVDSTLKSGVLDDNPRAPDESFGTRRGNSAVE